MNYPNMEKQVVIVTGANSGIGKAIGEHLIREKMITVLLSKSDHYEQMNTILNEDKILSISLDVRNPDSIQKCIDYVIKKFGRIDALINVAGIAHYGGIEDCSVKQWEETFDINAKGYFLLCKAVFPHLKAAQRGSIINLSSIWGTRGSPIMFAYASSKFAVEGLTKCLQEEARGHGVKVTSLILDKVDTPFRDLMKDKVNFSEEQKQRMLAVEDIVDTVMFVLNSSSRSLPSSMTLEAYMWK